MALPPEVQIPYPQMVEAATDSVGTLVMEDLIQFLEDEWIATYYDMSPHSPSVMKFQGHGFIFLYDQASVNASDVDDRLVAAYGWSTANTQKKDKSRMRGFLGGGIDIPGKGEFDKGHALAHAMGGGLDANLFPQRPELNRGRSEAGRAYRRMEKYAASYGGTFVFSRLIYGDSSWVPSFLEYGVLMQDEKLWVEWFEN
ncbi:MAG: hypothetical protein ACXWT1_11350 [Methylobacter sp.]